MTTAQLQPKAQRILRRALQKCAQAKRWYPGQPAALQAELALVSSVKMRRLNQEFRKKDYATDVLSFPSPLPLKKLGHLGELVICMPVLKRQAKEQGHQPETELAVLIVHGLLHLLGLDHEEGPAALKTQARWEAKILAALKIKAEAGLISRSK
jgi:probable rRNA maturation factor